MSKWRSSVKITSSIFLARKFGSSINPSEFKFRTATCMFAEERIRPLTQSAEIFNSTDKTATGGLSMDKEDIKRHESIASEWWDLNGPMKALHAMNDIRIQLIRNGLENTKQLKGEDVKSNPKYLSGFKIMDVGCGGGILSEALARLGADVTGIDPSEVLIELAKKHAAENALMLKSAPTYIRTSIEDHSASNSNLYDVIVASEVIEHVSNKRMFLESCIKTLKPGGSIFITTPNRTTPSWLTIILLAENVFRIVPKGVHSWEQFITPTELQLALQTCGCRTIVMNGMMYNVLTNSWFWLTCPTLHYAIHAVKSDPLSSSAPVKKNE